MNNTCCIAFSNDPEIRCCSFRIVGPQFGHARCARSLVDVRQRICVIELL